MKYLSGISQETLRNNSICVKEGGHIRNIIDDDDIETQILVYVSNISTSSSIQPNELVRYAIVNLNFR